MYANCRECIIVCNWGFLLNRLVSTLWGNTFLFRLSRTRSSEIGGLPFSGVSVTTPEVTRGTQVVSPFDHRVLRPGGESEDTEISWWVFLYFIMLTSPRWSIICCLFSRSLGFGYYCFYYFVVCADEWLMCDWHNYIIVNESVILLTLISMFHIV